MLYLIVCLATGSAVIDSESSLVLINMVGTSHRKVSAAITCS